MYYLVYCQVNCHVYYLMHCHMYCLMFYHLYAYVVLGHVEYHAIYTMYRAMPPNRDDEVLFRDPRGFAMKFYTEEGNWDLVGNNTPIFFIRHRLLTTDSNNAQVEVKRSLGT